MSNQQICAGEELWIASGYFMTRPPIRTTSEEIVLVFVRVCYSKSSGQLGGLPRRFKLTAHPRWRNRLRSQLIGTGHLDTTRLRIRMIDRQRATPLKCVRFSSLSWIEGDAGRSLSTSIVDRITEPDGTAGAIRRDVEESRIGHG